MLVSVDIKKIENHLSILRKELKESSIIIEILMTIYQTTENPNAALRQLQFMKNEKACIQKKIFVLENAIDKFSNLKTSVDDTLNEAIEILNFHKTF